MHHTKSKRTQRIQTKIKHNRRMGLIATQLLNIAKTYEIVELEFSTKY